MAIVSDYRDCLAVAFGDDAGLGVMSWCVEGHPVANLEALHLLLHARLLKVAQACDDLMVELCELGLAEFGDVDVRGSNSSSCGGGLPPVWQQILDAAVQMGRQPGQDVRQISPRIVPVEFG